MSLQAAAGKGQQDHMVRFLALTFLKNFVQRFWADDQGYIDLTLCRPCYRHHVNALVARTQLVG